ncbi:MAG: hypothetical protein WA888_14960 [Burkholderiaceae bacterium]
MKRCSNSGLTGVLRRLRPGLWAAGIAVLGALSGPVSGSELNELVIDTVEMHAPQVRTLDAASQELNPAVLRLAEQDYQAGRFGPALDRFGIAAAMSNHPFAWLRVGNIWHRRGHVAMALDAYARARTTAAKSPGHLGLLKRANMNLALLGLDQAKRSLQTIGMQKNPADAAWFGEVGLRIAELQRVLPEGPQHFTSAARSVNVEKSSGFVKPSKSPRLPQSPSVRNDGGTADRVSNQQFVAKHERGFASVGR